MSEVAVNQSLSEEIGRNGFEKQTEPVLDAFQESLAHSNLDQENTATVLNEEPISQPIVKITPLKTEEVAPADESEFGVKVNELDKLTTDTEEALNLSAETSSPKTEGNPSSQEPRKTIEEMVEKSRPELEDPHPGTSQPEEPQEQIKTIGEAVTPPETKYSIDPNTEYQKALQEISQKIGRDEEVNPEIEYQRALEEIHEENGQASSAFDSLKSKYGAENQPSTWEKTEKEWSVADRVRHKFLEVEARRQGVSDTEMFNQVVEYFETEFSDNDHVTNKYKSGLSDDVKQRIVEGWKKKGWEAYYSDNRDGTMTFARYRDKPYRVDRDNVKVLRAFLDTGQNPIPVIQALRNAGVRINQGILNSHYLVSNYGSDTQNLIKLLWSPNLKSSMTFIEKMGQVPHSEWSLHSYGSNTQLERIREMAESGTLPEYSDDFYKNVAVLAGSMNRKADMFQLPKFKELLYDPEKVEFLSSAILSGNFPIDKDFDVFDSLDKLQQDGLMKPLMQIMSAKGPVGKVFGGYEEYYPERVMVSQEDINTSLKEFLGEESTRNFIDNKEMQEFCQVASKIAGKEMSIKGLEESFDKRKEIVAAYNLILKGREGEAKEAYYSSDSPFSRSETLVRSDEISNTLFSSDFQDFLKKLQSNGEFQVQPKDFFSQLYGPEIDMVYRAISRPTIIALYRINDVVEMVGDSSMQEVISGFRDGYATDSHNKSDELWRKYSEFAKYTSTLQLLKECGVVIDKENLQRTDWIAQISAMPLLEGNSGEGIPAEFKRQWVDAALKLPYDLQNSLLGSIRDENYKTVYSQESLAKVVSLAQLVSTSEFFPNTYRANDAGIGKIYGILGRYEGDISDLFQDGKPTKFFANLLIQENDPESLLLVATDEVIAQFDEKAQASLRLWKEMPFQLRVLSITNKPSFPEWSEQDLHNFSTLNSIFSYAQINNLGKGIVDALSFTNHPEMYFSDGRPTREFVNMLIQKKYFGNLAPFLKEEVLNQYSEGERKVLAAWDSLPMNLRGYVINREPSFPVIPPDNIEKYEAIVQLSEFTKHAVLQPSILDADTNILKIIPERCAWMGEPENTQIIQYVFENALIFLQDEGGLDFINKVVQIAAQDSLAIFKEYRDYIGRNPDGPKGFEDIIDYAYKFNNPQAAKDPSLRRGYKMFGDYLTLDSYLSVKGIMNGSVSDEVLSGMGITLKGEEGLAQLETKMQGFILGLAKGNSDLSLLEHKIFSDFLKSYVRYDVSAWGNHSSDNFSRVVQTLQRIRKSTPELLDSDMPSSGIQEIAKIERAKTNESTFTDSFISRYSTFTDNIQQALDAINQPRSFSGIARNIKAKIDEQVLELEGDLEKNIDKPQAHLHIQKRIDKLKTVNPSDVKSFQANFSALAQEKVFNNLLMQAVFAYTLQKFPEQRERMAQVLVKETPDVDSISAILDFTEHMTTKEAWKTYFTDKNAKRGFQNILDTKEINDGLSRLTEDKNSSRSVTPVEFVPTRGILMEFSGYIADACWASRYDNSAEQFPNITTIVMQDLSKDVPKLLGSCLLIETTSNGGEPLLIIRGLNPLESYINHVDIPDFYGKFTDYVKRLAELKGGKAAIVIDDHSGGASTNRPLLFNFLSNQKNNLSRINVPSENTTFNGYNISNSTYLLPT